MHCRHAHERLPDPRPARLALPSRIDGSWTSFSRLNPSLTRFASCSVSATVSSASCPTGIPFADSRRARLAHRSSTSSRSGVVPRRRSDGPRRKRQRRPSVRRLALANSHPASALTLSSDQSSRSSREARKRRSRSSGVRPTRCRMSSSPSSLSASRRRACTRPAASTS